MLATYEQSMKITTNSCKSMNIYENLPTLPVERVDPSSVPLISKLFQTSDPLLGQGSACAGLSWPITSSTFFDINFRIVFYHILTIC